MALHQFESPNTAVIARPSGKGRFQAEIQVRGNSFLADEPVEVGGEGAGPTPYELLSGALAACTAMTIRLYAERKSWTLPPFAVEVAHSLVPGKGDAEPPRDRFERHIAFEESIGVEQTQKLLEIADKCPVHRTLMRGFIVETTLGGASEHPIGEAASRHEQDLEAVCAE